MGLVLATAGSAVGLGNLWRFSYVTGENGGAAFVVIYIICVILLGIPCMVGEFIIGRSQGANAVRAYAKLPKANNWWGLVGALGVLTSIVILGFYCVVAGWCLHYLGCALADNIPATSAESAAYFKNLNENTWYPVIWGIVFLLLTHVIVRFGVKNGIERVSKYLMPVLLFLLFVLMVAACSLPGAWRGVKFLFQPDWDCVNVNTFIEALGQAFFSLSLGMTCLCTYASYFDKGTNLVLTANQIAILDTMVAILAGLIIFPAAFAVGVQPDSGPGLVFVTLPGVFHTAFAEMPTMGFVISVMFYALIVLAALTSTISMHEVGTAFFTEETKLSRPAAAWIMTIITVIITFPCALSQGLVPQFSVLGMDLLSFLDTMSGNYFMPIGALLSCAVLGWIVPSDYVRREFVGSQPRLAVLFLPLIILLRFVCPIFSIVVMLSKLGLL